MKRKIIAAFLAAAAAATSAASVSVTAPAEEKLVTAVIDKNEVTLNAELFTGSYYWGNWYSSWNWNAVSPISDFVDNQGRYTIAYSDGKTIFISHIDSNPGISDTVKLTQPMNLIGGVTCDDSGNFYVACGQEDAKGLGGVCTFAVYKYSPEGEYLGKAEYVSGGGEFDTKIPFDAGNCAMAFHGDLLICSYAREMYSGHQSNDVFCVNTADMSVDESFDSYTSHSFNQCVTSLSNGNVLFADHGDAYPRGISVKIDFASYDEYFDERDISVVPFSFYGETGDNFTNARLTGTAELDTGAAIVGSSAKSYSEAFTDEKQQLFLQIIDIDSGESILGGSTRPGTGDKGILWLTDYTNGSEVRASAMAALDRSRLLVMWEEWNDGEFVNSYYSIVSSDGKILKDSVPMQKAMINGAEELDVIGDTAYWVYAGNEKTAEIYRLDTSKVSDEVLKDADITLQWTEKAYTGKSLKPAVTVKYNGKTLKKGTDYTVTYKNNVKPGEASVTVKGAGKYGGSKTLEYYITPKAVTKPSAKRTTKSKNTLTWSKSKYAGGYEVEINKYVRDKVYTNYYNLEKTVVKNTSKTKFTHICGKNSDVIFTYRVRPYIKVDGRKIYGEWSDSINPYDW